MTETAHEDNRIERSISTDLTEAKSSNGASKRSKENQIDRAFSFKIARFIMVAGNFGTNLFFIISIEYFTRSYFKSKEAEHE